MADEAGALASYQRQRDALLRETYDITCALSEYPEPGRFVQLQRQLAEAIDAEARFLAALPAVSAPARRWPRELIPPSTPAVNLRNGTRQR